MGMPIDPHVSMAAFASSWLAVAIGCHLRGEVSPSLSLYLSLFLISLLCCPLAFVAAASGVVVAVHSSRARWLHRASLADFENALCAVSLAVSFCAVCNTFVRRAFSYPPPLFCAGGIPRDERPSESENAATHGRLVNSVNHRHHRLPALTGPTQCDAFCVSPSSSRCPFRSRARAHTPVTLRSSVFLCLSFCARTTLVSRVHHLRGERWQRGRTTVSIACLRYLDSRTIYDASSAHWTADGFLVSDIELYRWRRTCRDLLLKESQNVRSRSSANFIHINIRSSETFWTERVTSMTLIWNIASYC